MEDAGRGVEVSLELKKNFGDACSPQQDLGGAKGVVSGYVELRCLQLHYYGYMYDVGVCWQFIFILTSYTMSTNSPCDSYSLSPRP